MPRARQANLLLVDDNELAESELLQSRKIIYRLKPFSVQNQLSKKYYYLIKEKEKLECSVCYDEICCERCFTLLSCGHYFHRDCLENCITTRCPLCNV